MRSLISTLIARISTPLLSIIAIALFLSGCGKDKASEPELPPAGVETTSLFFISPISVELTGKLINQSNQKITDHGFVYWYGAEADIAKGVKVSLGADIVSGFYTATLNDLQFPVVNGVQAVLVVKAYVTDKNGTRYGQVYSSNYKGTLSTDVSPAGGKTGDVITINGSYKGLKAGDIKVTFAKVEGKVKTVADKAITVEVPTGIPVVHGQTVVVKVQVGVVSTDVALTFYIWANIKDINPKSGPIGTKITFTGDNLPVNRDGMLVSFGEASADRYYDAAYFVRVPSTVETEKVKLYYYGKDAERKELPFEFTVTPPVIKSITPNPAFSQQELTIHMGNMEPYTAGNEPIVTIDHFRVYVRPNENGDLVFKPDFDLTSGENHTVTVSHGPHTVTAPLPLTIIKQEVTGFSPKKGFPGTALHITGRFAKGSTTNFLTFGNEGYVFADAISDTELIAYVPLGLENKINLLYALN